MHKPPLPALKAAGGFTDLQKPVTVQHRGIPAGSAGPGPRAGRHREGTAVCVWTRDEDAAVWVHRLGRRHLPGGAC